MALSDLLAAGRFDDAIRQLRAKQADGDASVLNDLAIVYRRAGRKTDELATALEAFERYPASPAVSNTLLRALLNSNRMQAAAKLYNTLSVDDGMQKSHHQVGVWANSAINRINDAKEALLKLAPSENDVADLETSFVFARAASDRDRGWQILDRLESLGLDVSSRRLALHFEAGRYEDCIRSLEDLSPSASSSLSVKTALLAAVMCNDRATLLRLRDGVAQRPVRSLVDAILNGEHAATVRFGELAFKFPLLLRNLSIAIPHAGGAFYEIAMLQRLARLISRESIVIDVGANVGNHAVFFAGVVGSIVMAFECNPRLTDPLQTCVVENGLRDRIDLAHLGHAVADRNGEIGFQFEREDFSRVSDGPGVDCVVPCLTLDGLNLERVNLLKIDVDGGELSVLAGASDTIGKLRPFVAIEVMNCNTEAVLSFMRNRSYVAVFEDFSNDAHSDFVFSPREHIEQVSHMF